MAKSQATLALSMFEATINDMGFMSTRSFGPSHGHSLSEHGASEHSSNRQDHKRKPMEALTVLEKIDAAAERYTDPEVVAPWHLQQLASTLPVVQAALKPADYATRRARQRASVDEDTDRGQQRFGLPDFSEAGYLLLDPQDTTWDGDDLYERLGLYMAIHPVTAVQYLCVCQKKSRLPSAATSQQFVSFASKVKKSDHINVLRCVDVLEDDSTVYVLHDYIPCTTFASVLESGEQESWTEEVQANFSREVVAALSYMSQYFGMHHQGLTLSHVLVPLSSLREGYHLTFIKVYGFGLASLLYTVDTLLDRSCFTPELLVNLKGRGAGGKDVLASLAPNQFATQDSWALGVITYTVLCGRVPFNIDVEADVDIHEMTSDLAFPPIFDSISAEARQLIEGLLTSASSRLTPAAAKRSPWFRKMWRTDRLRTEAVFLRVERFCHYSVAKRAFGRFLARFLDAKGHLRVAREFYDLDINGDGYLTTADLVVVGKHLQKRKELPQELIQRMGSTVDHISFTYFAACMSEEAIDGRCLRLAFESIDEDGSEQITAAELHEQLRLLNPNLGLQEVKDYIASVEEDAEGVCDHALDFEEFSHLFPERVLRVKAMQERLESSRSQRATLVGQFAVTRDDATSWMDRMESYRQVLRTHKGTAIEQFRGDELRTKACDKIRSGLHQAHEGLLRPPGMAKHDQEEAGRSFKKSHKSKKHKKHGFILFGFDTFLADCADHQEWSALLKEEYDLVSKTKLKSNLAESDYLRVYNSAEHAESKIMRVLQWARDQIEEYSSFTEAFESERRLPKLATSGRGLLRTKGDDAEEGAGHELEVVEGTSSVLPSFFFLC